MCNVSEEMPKYRSHKIVHALKIKTFVQNESNGDPKDHNWATAIPENTRYAPFDIDRELFIKHKPGDGWYYIAYPDGYKSFSPAEAFESGYMPVVD